MIKSIEETYKKAPKELQKVFENFSKELLLEGYSVEEVNEYNSTTLGTPVEEKILKDWKDEMDVNREYTLKDELENIDNKIVKETSMNYFNGEEEMSNYKEKIPKGAYICKEYEESPSKKRIEVEYL